MVKEINFLSLEIIGVRDNDFKINKILIGVLLKNKKTQKILRGDI